MLWVLWSVASPAADDDEDCDGDDEDHARGCRANDQRQLLMDAGLVLLWKGQTQEVTSALCEDL